MKKRIKYLDELRIFAILNIILLHILGVFFYKYYDISTIKYAFITLLSSFTRVGIPIFFMLTGILMLSKKEEGNYLSYFKKRVLKLIIAYIVFSIIYYIYHLVIGTAHFNIFELIREITSQPVEYHLWFMPIIILIYTFIPFIKKLVENLKIEELRTLIILIFITANIFQMIQSITTIFNYPLMNYFIVPSLICYINYVLVGYYIEKSNLKINKRLVILSILSILCIPIFTVFVSRKKVVDVFLNATSPFVMAPSILVYLLFKNKKENHLLENWIENNAKNVFYVYLSHVLFLNIILDNYKNYLTSKSLLLDLGIIILTWLVVSIQSFLFAYLWSSAKEFIKKYYNQIMNILTHILVGLLIGIFTLILFNLLINPYHFIKLNYGLTILGILCITGISYIIYKYQDKLFKNKIINILIIILYGFFQLLIAYCFMVKPSWDFGQIYDIAVSFAKSTHPSFGSAYLYMCDNNIMFSTILDIIYKIAYLLGVKTKFIELGICLNIIAIDVSIFYTYRFIKNIHIKQSKLLMPLLFFSSPLIFYIPIFYTDTLTLPFIIIPLYYFYKYLEEEKVKNIIIIGLLIGIGSLLKPTVSILGIAILLFLIIKRPKIKYGIFLSIMILLWMGPLVGQKLFINHFFDKTSLELYRIPTIHYISIGLERNGEYSEERFKEINKENGQDYKINISKQHIKDRLKEMKEKKEFISFYNRKISYTWTDGTFYSFEKLRREPIHEKYTKYIYSNDNFDNFYWTISNSEWIMILILMINGMVFRKYLPKKIQDLSLIINITIFGLFLFLLLWETRSRYLVNYVPLFIVNASIGLLAVSNYWKRKKDGSVKE